MKNIPQYELTGDSFEITGRGTVFTAILKDDCNRDDLLHLINTFVHGKPVKSVESFAIPELKKGSSIGLLV